MRFVVDDAPWAPDGAPSEALVLGLEDLARRLRAAVDRDETVVVYDDIWRMHLVGRHSLVDLLYDPENPANLPRDLRLAIGRALEACPSFDETELAEVDASVDGVALLSPAATLAHKNVGERAAVGCISPACSGRAGPLEVSVAGVRHTVHYVADEASHVAFFRAAFEVENADEDDFAALALHAFPDLAFADNLWRGLRDFSKSYRDRRDDLVEALGAFSDHGRRIFALPQSLWIAEFGAVGLTISPESSNDMRGRCLTHRQRTWRGKLITFEWHIKLDPHIDRIHVASGYGHTNGPPIVGILIDHLPLSSRGEC